MFKNGLERVKNLMQIMHMTLISHVQVPVAYVSSLVLAFLNILNVWVFYYFLFF